MVTIAQDRTLPDIEPNPENKTYFDGAAEGKLMLKKCGACNRFHFHPRQICPHCFSDNTQWVQAEGTGQIYTYSVLRLGTPTPFALAYVTLKEGVTMMTNIVDTDLDELFIGMPVTVTFKATEGNVHVPMFTPMSADQTAEQ